MATKPTRRSRGKTATSVRHYKSAREPSEEQRFVVVRTEAVNAYNNAFNRLVAPIRRERRKLFVTGALTEDALEQLKKKELEAIKRLNAQNADYLKSHPLPVLSGLTERPFAAAEMGYERLPDWAHLFLDEDEPAQPGTLVQGSGHPCCRWYARVESKGWNATYGPNLSPQDYAVTGFSSNWLADNRFQVCFDVDGTHDDEYTTYYSAQTTFHTQFDAVRPGRIYFRFAADFHNAYLYARGSSDFWDSDDYGWAGAYYWINVRRARAGENVLIYNSRNNTSSSVYYNSSWVPLLEEEQTSSIQARGWPGGENAAWFWAIPDMARTIALDNNGNMIRMEAGDTYILTLAFLFDAQAFGDERATGGVQICSAYGNPSYVDVRPVDVILEECPD